MSLERLLAETEIVAETFAKLEKRSANTLVATRVRDRVDRFHDGRFALAVEPDRTRGADSLESFDDTAGIPHLPQLLEEQLAVFPPDFDNAIAGGDLYAVEALGLHGEASTE